MSNIGANIWVTSEAILEPALNANVNDGGVEANALSATFAGNTTGASVSANAVATLDALQPMLVTVDAEARSLTFAGNIEGGAVFADAEATLQALVVNTEEWTPDINGVYADALSLTIASAFAWKYPEVDANARSATFSGNIEGGVVFANAKATLETQPYGGMQTFGAAWLPGLAQYVFLASDVFDSVESSVVAITDAQIIIHDTVRASSVGSTLASLNIESLDQVIVRSMTLIPYVAQILDTLEVGDSPVVTAFKLVQAVSEALALSEIDSVGLELRVTAASVLTLHDVADNVLNLTLEDAVNLLAENSALLQANLDALTEVEAASSADNVATFVATVEDATGLESQASAQAWLQATAEDDVELFVQIKVGDEIIQGWVVNTETTAFSEYTNYPFNSLAEADGVYYGLAEDGLYRLEGDDDAGVPIQALIRTGLSDMGTHFIKDAKAAHIGYNSDGKLLLRVTTTAKGQKEQWWYELKQAAATSSRDGRFTIGRGLRAKYWQFELVNLEGADFEIDSFEVMYNVLNRRIR